MNFIIIIIILTLTNTVDRMANRGTMVPTTRVIFQLVTKAIVKLDKTVDKYIKKIAAVSPIPA